MPIRPTVFTNVLDWLLESTGGFALLWVLCTALNMSALNWMVPEVFTTSMLDVVGFAAALGTAYLSIGICQRIYARRARRQTYNRR